MDTPFIFKNDILKGQVALITGGASGIGLATAHRMAMAGANVVLASRRFELCQEKADEIAKAHGVRALALPVNVRDTGSVEECLAQTVENMGHLDILVNNAAGNFYYPSHMLSDNQWKAVLEIDLYGTFHCSRAAFPYLKDDGGLIVNLSMTLHHTGWACMLPACAAKSGIDAITRTLAVEWGRYGIRVNGVAPGPVPTEGVKKAFALGGSFESDFSTIPLGRAGEPEEIADTIVFLASPAATWITGETITLDGGERLSPNRRAPDPIALEEMIKSHSPKT